MTGKAKRQAPKLSRARDRKTEENGAAPKSKPPRNTLNRPQARLLENWVLTHWKWGLDKGFNRGEFVSAANAAMDFPVTVANVRAAWDSLIECGEKMPGWPWHRRPGLTKSEKKDAIVSINLLAKTVVKLADSLGEEIDPAVRVLARMDQDDDTRDLFD
jgi:hypothetical protein